MAMKKSNDPKRPDDAGASEQGSNEHVGPADYLREVKAKLRIGEQKDAFILLRQAVVRFPEDPLIVSYFGCLQALVDKKYRHGVESCKRAIVLMRKAESFGEDVLYPVLYLNLGRAYVAADKKKDAVTAFTSGLQYDNGNHDLQNELKVLGMRKKPPVPFLDRSNPINKYIGMILQQDRKELAKGKSRGQSR